MRLGVLGIASVSLVILPAMMPAGAASVKDEARPSPVSGRVAARIAGKTFKALLESDAADMPLTPGECDVARQILWSAYKDECLKDTGRVDEVRSKRMAVPALMRYAYRKVGDKPPTGYPLIIALHGGGGAPTEVNDDGWRHMQTYYLESIKQGIYLAPRGIRDTWCLHFEGASYPLYDRLIENMILFEDADPNRVYLIGYSAGGDGVHQVAPRMADRFAAANMSAGHPNDASPLNLYNLPFLIQGGENDTAYGRHRAFAAYGVMLDTLAAKHPGAYIHDTFIHTERGHGVPDNQPNMQLVDIIANPAAWLNSGDRTIRKQNTNAIAWLERFTRNPWPTNVLWEVGMRADRSGTGPDGAHLWLTPNRGRQFYWLDLSRNWETGSKTRQITARIDRARNAVCVETDGDYVGILLNGRMLDLRSPVTVEVGQQKLTLRPQPNLKTLVATLADRGDPSYMFEVHIALKKADGKWTVR